MRKILTAFIANQDGATAIEYGLIAVVIITGLTTVGTTLNTNLSSIATSVR
jgi:pilus assembly protein Flp/PilA